MVRTYKIISIKRIRSGVSHVHTSTESTKGMTIGETVIRRENG